MFTYSDSVSNLFINWSVPTTDPTKMDMNLIFSNPNSTGVNGGLNHFQMDILDSNSVVIGIISNIPFEESSNGDVYNSVGSVVGQYNITYNSGLGLYTCLLNDIPYYLQGTIRIYSYVTNNNTDTTPSSDPILTNTFINATGTYSTTDIPRFIKIVNTSTTVTGNIISYQALKPTGQVFYPTGASPPIASIAFNTNGSTGLVIPAPTVDSAGVYIYSFTLTKSTFFQTIGMTPPSEFSISVSNDAGIGPGHTPPVQP